MSGTAKPRKFLSFFLSFALVLTSMAPLGSPAMAASRGFSAIAVDAYTGKVLVARNADDPRYPASITKVMTLYILFEDMRAGRFNKNSQLKVSRKASRQPPSKLNLKPGDTIRVDDAIKGLVTRSANDVAMVVAENVAGSEAAFADRMTRTARKLGMTRTTFKNPSGLPNKGQITTARDIATLSLRIQRDFPEYYGYFKIPSFVFRGQTITTHNKLIGRFQGTDGIKTGYINASGYNLSTSVARDGKRLVGVVLGAPSGGARNRYMMAMLEPLFAKATAGKKVALVAGNPPGYKAQKPTAPDKESATTQTDAEDALAAMAKAKPVPAETASVPLPRVKPAVPAIVEAKIDTPEEAPVAPQALPEDVAENEDDGSDTGATTYTAVVVEEPQQDVAAMVSPEPMATREDTKAVFAEGELVWPVATSAMKSDYKSFKPVQTASAEPVPVPMPEPAPAAQQVAAAEPAAEPQAEPEAPAPSGWMVQIGAWKLQKDAERRLARAEKLNLPVLDGKQAVTMSAQQKGATVYTARFAGFENEKSARLACRALSRKGIGCVSLAPGQSG